MTRNQDTMSGLPRERSDLRRDLGLSLGVLVLGFCFHTWVDSFLIVKMSRSITAAEATNLGGLLAGALALGVGVILGWIGGGWLTESRRPLAMDACSNGCGTLNRIREWFDRYPASRGLLFGALAMAIGVAMGLWALLGGLTMIVAVSLGYWGRAMALRQ